MNPTSLSCCARPSGLLLLPIGHPLARPAAAHARPGRPLLQCTLLLRMLLLLLLLREGLEEHPPPTHVEGCAHQHTQQADNHGPQEGVGCANVEVEESIAHEEHGARPQQLGHAQLLRGYMQHEFLDGIHPVVYEGLSDGRGFDVPETDERQRCGLAGSHDQGCNLSLRPPKVAKAHRDGQGGSTHEGKYSVGLQRAVEGATHTEDGQE
mmetsp:Transcript_13799/g.33924  ORF Transcript_13799/g.33924 Transcript_13799/m.33924 type:complete len:209 (-) Transcript_13799:2951-3577(-)